MGNAKETLESRAPDSKFDKYKTACLQYAFAKAAADEDGLVEAIYKDEPYRVYFENQPKFKYRLLHLMRVCNAAFRSAPPRSFFSCNGEDTLQNHGTFQAFVKTLDNRGVVIKGIDIGYDEAIRFNTIVAGLPFKCEYVDLKLAVIP